MLLFGHIGLTAGIVRVCQKASFRMGAVSNTTILSGTGEPGRLPLHNRLKSVDYRFILVGALLPDIIDKSVWLFSASSFQWRGRGYSHTFLFLLILFTAGLAISSRRGKPLLLYIAAGDFFHLVFDQMWKLPTSLWWPLFGPIGREEVGGWFYDLWEGLISNPSVFIPEISGLLISLYFLIRLLKRRQIIYFLKTGDIG